MAGYYILRHAFPVDTSGLDDSATISAATFNVRNNNTGLTGDNDAQAYAAVVQTTTASDTTLATSDYDNFGTTKGSDNVACTTIAAIGDNYVTYTLNATGLGWINKTGYTKLGILEGHDIENSAVGGRNSAGAYMSETAGTDKDPYLSVTYTVGDSGHTKNMLLLGVA